MELRPTPGARLFAFIRSQAGLSQTSFAVLLGTSKATLSRIENGTGKPTAKHYQRLAHVFGLTPAQLVDAQYNRNFESMPGRGYSPQLPGMHDISLKEQQSLWVELTDDCLALKRTIARTEKKLLDVHVLEEVRSASRAWAQQQLAAQQEVLQVLEQSGSAPRLLAAQQANVELAEKELKSIQSHAHLSPAKQAYQQRKLNRMKAEPPWSSGC